MTIFFFINSYNSFTPKKSLSEKILEIPPAEKIYLTNFYRYTFFLSSFGYTIFGSKPMSFDTVNLKHHLPIEEGADYMDIFHIFDRYKHKKCWKTWQRYSHLFSLKGFSFVSYEFPLSPDFVEVAIINHKNFLKTVAQHLTDFHEVLGLELSPEAILQEYVKGQGEVFYKIRMHDGLFGTLLGFGRNNAWEFMDDSKRKSMQKFFPFSDPQDSLHVLRPCFKVIRASKETNSLRKAYEKERLEIDKIYQQPDFLEQVLMKLASG